MTDADDPAHPVVAYCAPGLKNYAARLLESNGERVREVIEHPYMHGRNDVILTTDPDWGRNHEAIHPGSWIDLNQIG